MTIKRGQPWGDAVTLPNDAPVANTDADLAALIQADLDAKGLAIAETSSCDHAGGHGISPIIGLTGGDLHRTLGSPSHSVDDLRSGAGMGFPMDLGVVEFDAPSGLSACLFVAHLIATSDPRSRLWKGRSVILINAAFRGTQNLAPHGHPNDGRLDLIDGSLGWLDRKRALERVYAGAHVPHPQLKESRVRSVGVSEESGLHIWADGIYVCTATEFTVNCLSDAFTVVV
ncbi:MAG: hypothetical protein KDB26_12210 [Microthrixaceae bacterium]|nr:hypothetical protein [Microthrixaceae bacterium]